MFKNSKSGKTQFDMASLILIGLVIYVVWSMGLFGGVSKQAVGDQNGQPADSVIKVVGAPCTQGTTLTSSMIRRYTETALTAENVTVVQNGVEKVTVANGGTTTVQSGPNADTLDLYPAFQSTTYYPQHVNGKINTCTSSATSGDPVFKFVQDESPGGTPVTYSDGPNKVVFITDSVTIDIVNDGQADSQSATNQVTGENLSIGTGATGSVSLTFKVDYNEGWAIHGGVMACQWPSAVYDSVSGVIPSVNGVNLIEADKKPSSDRFVLVATNSTSKAWKFPGIDGRLNSAVPGKVLLKASSNNDPQGIGDRVNCTVFDTSYYKKQGQPVGKEFVLDTENRDTQANLGGADTLFDFVIGVE